MKCPKCAGELREENELLVCDSCGAIYPKGVETPAEGKDSVEVRPAAQKSEEQLRIELLERRLAEMEAKQTAGKASPASSAKDKIKKFFQSIPSFIRSHKKAAAFSAFGLLAVILIIVLCTSLCGVRGVYVNKANAEDYYVFSSGSYIAVSNLGGEDMEEKGKWKASGGKITFTVKDEMFGKISESFDFKKSKDNDLIEIDGTQYERVARSIKSKVKITLDANGGEGGIHKKIRIGSKIEVKEPTREGFVFLGYANSEGEFFNDYERIWKSASYKAKWRCVEHPESAIQEKVLKEATCGSDGLRGRVCSVCECVVSSEIIPATGEHAYGEWKTVVAATCTEDGEMQGTCAVCGIKESESIPATGHYYDVLTKKCVGCDQTVSSFAENTMIAFGLYPQTKVTDRSLTSALDAAAGTLPTSSNSRAWTSYRYYNDGSISNYMWYIDLEQGGEKYRGVYFTSYRPYDSLLQNSSASNSLQDDNGYNTSTVYWFKYEPIKWRILSEANGEALILCESIIDSQEYYNSTNSRTIDGQTVYPSNYEYSNIRAWLNDTFYNTAFNDLQKQIILLTTVDNSARSTNNTEDYVFLLSEQEVTNSAYGFDSSYSIYDSARGKITTDYAKSQGAFTYTRLGFVGNGYWWLRSPSYNYSNRVRRVDYYGSAFDYDYVCVSDYGVVPALKIKLD